jgi:hypothetical protein
MQSHEFFRKHDLLEESCYGTMAGRCPVRKMIFNLDEQRGLTYLHANK